MVEGWCVHQIAHSTLALLLELHPESCRRSSGNAHSLDILRTQEWGCEKPEPRSDRGTCLVCLLRKLHKLRLAVDAAAALELVDTARFSVPTLVEDSSSHESVSCLPRQQVRQALAAR